MERKRRLGLYLAGIFVVSIIALWYLTINRSENYYERLDKKCNHADLMKKGYTVGGKPIDLKKDYVRAQDLLITKSKTFIPFIYKRDTLWGEKKGVLEINRN